jgi:hypothetical protein
MPLHGKDYFDYIDPAANASRVMQQRCAAAGERFEIAFSGRNEIDAASLHARARDLEIERINPILQPKRPSIPASSKTQISLSGSQSALCRLVGSGENDS